MSDIRTWVVKLGGSLMASPDLRAWLSVLPETSGLRVLVVPGGGLFADAVRAAQAQWGFGDLAAHEKAVEAMYKFGRMLLALRPGAVPIYDLDECSDVWVSGAIPVWLPGADLVRQSELPATWECTSDTIAAWAAIQIQASDLVLTKLADLTDSELNYAALASRGIVDPLFPAWARRGRFQCWCCRHPDELRALLCGSAGGAIPITDPIIPSPDRHPWRSGEGIIREKQSGTRDKCTSRRPLGT